MAVKFTLAFKCPTCNSRITEVPFSLEGEKMETLLAPYKQEIEQRSKGGLIYLQGSPIQCPLCKEQQKVLGLVEFLGSVRNPAIPGAVQSQIAQLSVHPEAVVKAKKADKDSEAS